MRRIVQWKATSAPGLEHLVLDVEPDRVVAESLVLGREGAAPYGLRYRVVCDAAWRVRELSIAPAGDDDELVLTANGYGRWFDAAGQALRDLEGCLDLDISVTPFTNTLPIRRLSLREREGRNVRVVYVSVPGLVVGVAEQRYTCLQHGRTYRYEEPGFAADLTVDAEGLVVRYPGLYERVA